MKNIYRLYTVGAHLSIGNNVPSMKIFAGGDIGGIPGRKTMLTRHSLWWRRKYLFFLCWKHLEQPHLLTSRLGLDLKELLSGSIQKQKLWRKTCVTKESFLFQISDVFHKNVYMLFKLVNKQLDGPGTRSDPQQKSHLCWGGRILTSHSPPVPLLSAKDVVLLKVSIF